MGAPYLIDTNVIIDYFENRLPAQRIIWLEQQVDEGACAISIINRIELFSFEMPSEDRAKLLDFTDRCSLIRLTDEVADFTILLRKTVKIKLPDAIIAATALVHNLELVTRKTDDFKNIPGLTVVNPFDLSPDQ